MIFIIWILFFDTNSILVHIQRNQQIHSLETDIEYYKEESFTRVKGTSHFPKKALLHVIKKYGLNNLNVDLCVFYEKPFLSWSSITYFSLKKPFLRWKISSNQFKKLWNGSLTFSTYTKKYLNVTY